MDDPISAGTGSSTFGIVGFIISVVLAGIKIAETVNARRDRSRDRTAKVNDAWFKTIVLDGVIPDIRQFVESQREALVQAASPVPGIVRPYMGALIRYTQATEQLKTRLQPVGELSGSTYEAVIRSLEKLDDCVAPFCPHADDASFNKDALDAEKAAVLRQFDNCFRDCLFVLRRLHFALSEGKDPDQMP